MNISKPLTTDLLHRGALAAKPQSLRPDPSLFKRIGGRPIIEKMTDDFYERIGKDPKLAPMFAGHLNQRREIQKLFFEEWMGGDKRFSQRTIVGLQRTHSMIHISKLGAGRWLRHLKAALHNCEVTEELCSEILDLLRPMAQRFVNTKEAIPSPQTGQPHWKWFEIPAQLAAKSDREGLQKFLAEEPSRALRQGQDSRTLLWEAVNKGRAEIVEFLVKQGVDVNLPGCYQMVHYPYVAREGALVMITPYCLAKWKRKIKIANYLLDQGALIDIFSTAFVGDRESTLALLDSEPLLADADDPAEDFLCRTPLLHAVAGGQLGIVELLLERGAQVRPHSKWLLTYAAARNHFEIVQRLLEHGADANESLLLGPLGGGDQRVADLLIARGFDVKRMPMAVMFSRADTGGKPAEVRALLEYGAEVDAGYGRTALHYAAQAGNPELIKVLLEYGANTESRDRVGNTPLITAAQKKTEFRTEAVSASLSGGANANATIGKSTLTPLHRAVTRNDLALAKLLLKHGALVKKSLVNLAVRKDNAEMIALLKEAL